MFSDFPASFYRSENQVQLSRTAVPTGMLQNPLDLVNHPRPWLMVNTALAQKTRQKKTLIFADHFCQVRLPYGYAGEVSLDCIVNRMRMARDEGFRILFLLPSGILEEWDGKNIFRKYSLDFKTFTTDFIRQLALKQHQLAADRLFILDHFGVNEMMYEMNNCIHFNTLKDHPSDFAQLISAAPHSDYQIIIEGEENLHKFLEQPELNTIHYRGIHLQGIDFEKEMDTTLHFSDFLAKWVGLELIHFNSCCGADAMINKLFVDDKLSNLKRINLENTDVGIIGVALLFQEAKQLEEVNFRYCDVGALKNFLVTINIKKIDLGCTTSNADDVAMLFRAAPLLEEINLDKCLVKSAFRQLTPNALKNLKNINLSNTILDSNDIAMLFQAAPQLEVIDLSNCRNIKNIFLRLDSTLLKKLKIIKLGATDITENDLVKLLQNTPQLEEIELDSLNITSAFQKMGAAALKNLKRISLNRTTVVADDLVKLFQAASQLEKIDLFGCRTIPALIQTLDIALLKNIKIITFGHTNIPVNFVEKLFKVTSHLEEVHFDYCGNLRYAFIKLACNQLMNLRKIYLYGVMITLEDVKQLLIAAPQLNGIYFNGGEISLDSLKKCGISFSDLEKIYSPREVKQSSQTHYTAKLDNSYLDTRLSQSVELSYQAYFPNVSPNHYRLMLWRPNLNSMEGPYFPSPVDFAPISHKPKDFFKDPNITHESGIKRICIFPLKFLERLNNFFHYSACLTSEICSASMAAII